MNDRYYCEKHPTWGWVIGDRHHMTTNYAVPRGTKAIPKAKIVAAYVTDGHFAARIVRLLNEAPDD